MPIGQVLMIDMRREFVRHANNYEKALYVPLRQSRRLTSDADRQLVHLGGKLEFGTILAEMILPAVTQVRQAQARVEWQRDALQTVEAVRMHLAETGDLPATLQEIKVVPVPLNPVTIQPFLYRREGQIAILELPHSDGFAGFAQRFEIQVAR